MSMLRSIALALGLLAAAVVAVPPAQAQQPYELTLEDRLELAKVEQYLQGIRTMRARFTQTSPQGTAAGDFYLKRPGRMRIDYDDPSPYLYVADGTWLTFWDGELEQRSDAPLGSTIADFITREDVTLTNNQAITITDLRRRPDALVVTVVQTEDPQQGSLTLVFAMNPVRLDRWAVLDAQGITTEVVLTNVEYGMDLANNLFVAPRPGGRVGGND